ncbi:MAG: hypothetical protein HQL31_07990, partial [Planctomycetes bacterium]|nr:hypothetical protein [Planctomycetota bacterium]
MAVLGLSLYLGLLVDSKPELLIRPEAAQETPIPLMAGKGSKAPQQQADAIPPWMVWLILGFLSLQMLPLVLAAKKARLQEITPRIHRTIEFYCDTPMYLGLLGSLVGV